MTELELEQQPRSRAQLAIDDAEVHLRRLRQELADCEESLSFATARQRQAEIARDLARERMVAWETAVGTLRRAAPKPVSYPHAFVEPSHVAGPPEGRDVCGQDGCGHVRASHVHDVEP